jgi:2,3-bisphosphoglycerate-independent phosphoglycerate mutase
MMNEVVRQAHIVLQHEKPANGILLRGFASLPNWPGIRDRYALRACAVAKYPMYRGVARLVGMSVAAPYSELQDSPGVLTHHWKDYDFFFLHFKDPDKAGEDGDFERKKAAIEAFDIIVPRLVDLSPDVLVVTGDHSTPVRMKQHSWHPVPVLLWAPATVRPDRVEAFGERAALEGGLGQRPMHELMSLMLAHAGRLMKFGA